MVFLLQRAIDEKSSILEFDLLARETYDALNNESWTIRSSSCGTDLAAARDAAPALWPCIQYPRQPVEAQRSAVHARWLILKGRLSSLTKSLASLLLDPSDVIVNSRTFITSPSLLRSLYREFIKYLYQQNLLTQNRMLVGKLIVNLENITCPVLNIMAGKDDLVPCAQGSVLRPRQDYGILQPC